MGCDYSVVDIYCNVTVSILLFSVKQAVFQEPNFSGNESMLWNIPVFVCGVKGFGLETPHALLFISLHKASGFSAP